MSTAYRRNIKNQYGRPDIIGRDVIDFGASVGPGIVWTTALTDRLGGTRYVAGTDCRLEGAHVSVGSGNLTLGRIGIQVLLDGTAVASGNLHVGGPTGGVYLPLPKETLQDVPVVSGQVLTANYAVEASLDTQQSLRVTLSLALLENAERV